MPNFSYGKSVRELFPTVVAQAREAEAAGFDTAFVMDHFYQLPGIGTPDEPMLEAYTALGGLATATERIQLSALVTGNTYRNPAMLAKTVTTLDVASGGRAVRSASARAGSNSSTAPSGTNSARSPTASSGSTRRCTSSSRCCAASGPPSRASGTGSRTP